MDKVLMWVLIGVLAAALVVGGIFLLTPKDNYIRADGMPIYKIPNDAEILSVNEPQAKAVKTLAQKNQLVVFVGMHQGTGTTQDEQIARIRAYEQIAEFLNSKVNTFAQLVEGQLQNVQVSGNKQDIVSASVSAYKRVTSLLADATVSGAYVYASWRVKRGNLFETYCLLVYDLGSLVRLLELDAQVQQTVKELGNQGVNFFQSLNAVVKEANKGTPLEQK